MSSQPLLGSARFAEISSTDEDAALGRVAYDTYAAIVESDSEDLDEDAAYLHDQRAMHKSLHWLYRPSVVMVGLMIFMFAFGTSSAEATRQMILFKLACNLILASSGKEAYGYCDPAETQVLVLSLQQAYSVARGTATIVALGEVGPLSDRHGRKVFLVVITVCMMAGLVLQYMLASTYATLQFWPMVAVEFFVNCSGGGLTVLTLANCYVSDIADASQRTYYLGINIASLFVGLSSGPLIGNFIIAYFKKKALKTSLPQAKYEPSLTSADFAPLRFQLLVFFVVFLFIVFVLPESRGEAARRKSCSLLATPLMSSVNPASRTSQANKFNKLASFCVSINFFRPLRLVFYPKDSVHRLRHKAIVRTRIAVLLLVMVDCLVSSLGAASGEICILYGVYKYKWTAVDIGHLMAIACSTRAVVLIVISPLIAHNFLHKELGLESNKRRFDRIDYGVVMIAFSVECVGQLFLGSAKTGTVFLATMAMNSVTCLAMPAIHASITKFYPESKIGELFGGMAIVKNVFSVILPVAVLGLYKASVFKWDFPQVIFLMFSGFAVVLALMMTVVIVLLDKIDAQALDAESVLESAH